MKATTCILFALLLTACIHAQPPVKVQTGVQIATTGGVVITLLDMLLDNDGIIAQQPGQGRFVFSGAGKSGISGTAVPIFDELEIAKTGSNTLFLQQHINIRSQLVFTAGNIDLNGHNILLQSDARLNGERETSRITGSDGGFVEITTDLNRPAGADPGKLGVLITSPENLGPVRIRRGHQSQKNAVVASSSILRYYDIQPGRSINARATLQIHYLDAELNNLDENVLVMYSSPDALRWTNNGFTVRSATLNFVEQNNFNTLNRFTLSEVNNPLPLKWASFNTQCLSGQTSISWKTLLEQNTSVFVIRRSTNGINWINIGSIPAAGNSQTTLNYTYIDAQPPAGTTYYQLMQQDLDGRSSYSPVLISKCAQPEHVKVYPTPASNNCWVSVQSDRSHTVSMQLYNAHGALLKQQVVTIMRGNNVFELSLINYAKGIYSLLLTWSDGNVKVIKVEKN